MAHRQRLGSAAIHPDCENLNLAPRAAAKANVEKVVRRPALDELSNKVNGTKPPLRRMDTLKSLKPIGEASKAVKLPPSYSRQQLEAIIDPDADSKNDPQMATEYVEDIFKYLRELEAKFPIRENYLQGHKSTVRMRAVLIDWLAKVHTSFKLCLETLHICVSVVDRYLQENKEIGRETLQLVGTSALLIACKYEEMYLPDLSDFVYVCDDVFSKREILKMEMDILIKLDCSLGKPVSLHFLRRYSKVARAKIEHHTLAKYLLELALLEYGLVHVKPSVLGAAACCLSLAVYNEVSCASSVWTRTLEHYTTYKYSAIKPAVVGLAHAVVKAETSKYTTIKSKYADASYHKVSLSPKLKGSLIRRLTSTTPAVKQ